MPEKIPANYPRLNPYLIPYDAKAAIAFYTSALGARERLRLEAPDGRIGHAELAFGDSILMLADPFPEMGVDPQPPSNAVRLTLYVDDVDGTTSQAVAARATLLRPPADQFYGDRTATIRDPFGFEWELATHIEDVPPEELRRRAEARMRTEN